MSGQLLVDAPDAPAQKHLHARFDFDDDGPELRFVDQRTFGGMALADLVPDVAAAVPRRRRWGVPSTSPTSPPTRSSRATTGPASWRGSRRAVPASSGRCWTRAWSRASATSTPTRRSGGPGCTASGDASGLTRPALRTAARPRPRGDGGRAGPGRHELRRPLRQRQRRQRLLRPVAARLRAGGPALCPLRSADPPGVVHEPLVLLLPPLPAATPRPAARLTGPGAGRTPRRHSPG